MASRVYYTTIPDLVRLLVLDRRSDFDFNPHFTKEMPDLISGVMTPMETLGARYMKIFDQRRLGFSTLGYMFDMCVQTAVLEDNFHPLLMLINGRLDAHEQFCDKNLPEGLTKNTPNSNPAKEILQSYSAERHLYESSRMGTRHSVRHFIQEHIFGRNSSNDIMLVKETLRKAVSIATGGIIYKPDTGRHQLSSRDVKAEKAKAKTWTLKRFHTSLRQYLMEVGADRSEPQTEMDTNERNADFMAQLTSLQDI